MEDKYLKLGQKIRKKLNIRGANLDYFTGTIMAEMIEKFVKSEGEKE